MNEWILFGFTKVPLRKVSFNVCQFRVRPWIRGLGSQITEENDCIHPIFPRKLWNFSSDHCPIGTATIEVNPIEMLGAMTEFDPCRQGAEEDEIQGERMKEGENHGEKCSLLCRQVFPDSIYGKCGSSNVCNCYTCKSLLCYSEGKCLACHRP